ncbi:MAG: Gfo/Idh/MocA family oxidoreductase [Thermomicrobiales bacterium]|nr:Gfo/Idh/MocA family oxidoreductase [Thermomicrobiales bacterium]
MSTLRAAIIGPGRIASTYDDEVPVKRPPEFFRGEYRHSGVYTVHPTNHAQAYIEAPGYELVGFAGRSSEKTEAFQQRWGVPGYADAAQMLAELKPDVVSITTQSAEKAELTILAAESGAKAIIVEKAMATSMAEADAMIAAADRAGALLIVNHPNRFSPMNRAGKALLDAGEIGEFGTVSAFSRGGMIHVGTHSFDAMRYFGGDIVEVSAWGPVEAEWSDRSADGWVRFASGKTGFFSHNHNASPSYEVRGKDGLISLSAVAGESWIMRTHLLDEIRAYPHVGTREPIEVTQDISTTRRLFDEVRAALLDGGPVISSGRDGAAALEAGIAALISAKSGQRVALPLVGEDRNVSIPNR